MSITFNGVSSDSLNVHVQFRPNQVHAARSVETQQVIGRNGLYLIDHGAYENVTQSYDCFYEVTLTDVETTMALYAAEQGISLTAARARFTFDEQLQMTLQNGGAKVANWLLNQKGYQRLEDSYEPDTFRLARYIGPMDIENLMLRAGRFGLEFDCKPQKFLKKDETGIYRIANMGTQSGIIPLVTTIDGTDVPLTVSVRTSGNVSTTFTVNYYDSNLTLLSTRTVTGSSFKPANYAPSGARHFRVSNSSSYTMYVTIDGNESMIGDTVTTFANPTNQISKPLIRVWIRNTSIATTVQINDYQVVVDANYYQQTGKTVIGIDCETMNCYYGGLNMNKYVTVLKNSSMASEYPCLNPGSNYIYCANRERIEIYPRWWRI